MASRSVNVKRDEAMIDAGVQGEGIHCTQSIPTSSGNDVIVLIPPPIPARSLFEAYLLCLPLGFLGLHHFYLRRWGFGVLYLLTGGLFGIGWLVDIFRLPSLVRETNRKLSQPEDQELEQVSLVDAYLLWFPLGILGLHHYYLRRWVCGIVYTFTAGVFGIGWIIDAFRLPSLVRQTNIRLQMERMSGSAIRRVKALLCDTYVLCLIPPLGILGAHHFYLRRYAAGIFYFWTLGGCGIGWIVDWFRLKWLVDRANHPERYPLGSRQKFVDDAYIYAFPFGLLGSHHFYLERPFWGLVYLFTGGLLGIGWLVDLCRMPCLVREANDRILNDVTLITVTSSSQINAGRSVVVPGSGQPGFVVCAPRNYGTYGVGSVNHPGAVASMPPPPPYPSSDTSASNGGGDSWVSVSQPPSITTGPVNGPPAYDDVNSGGYKR